MTPCWGRFGRRGIRPVSAGGRRGWILQEMTAREFLEAQADAEQLCTREKGENRALCRNAALVAGALRKKGKPVFADGGTVLKKLRPRQIEQLAGEYAQLAGGWDWQAGEKSLEKADFERLKWQVCRAFGILPTEERAERMTDFDYLFCALNLLLDREEGRETDGKWENPAFDPVRFRALKEGRK